MAAGSCFVVTVRTAAAWTAIVTIPVTDWGTGDDPSVTATATVWFPAVVGVPESTPAVLSVRPAGSVPLTRFHKRGAVPPNAPTATVIGLPCVAWMT